MIWQVLVTLPEQLLTFACFLCRRIYVAIRGTERHWEVTHTAIREIHWRTTAHYLPTLASKSSLLEETKLFLALYTQTGSTKLASQALLDTALPQRSRQTRRTIVRILHARFVQWNPPSWVLDDLAIFAQDKNDDIFRLAVLLHIARQDRLLYDFVQQVIVPHWYANAYKVTTSDVQGFLDKVQEEHLEITHWSYTTRDRLSQSVLTVLRNCRLLKGEVNKSIVAPTVPQQVVRHLMHLLVAEGIMVEDLAHHPDWQLLLWDSAQAQKAIDMVTMQERVSWTV